MVSWLWSWRKTAYVVPRGYNAYSNVLVPPPHLVTGKSIELEIYDVHEHQ